MPHENKQGNSKLFVAIFEETTIWNLLSSMTFLFFGDTVFPRRFAPIFTKQCWKNFQKCFKIPAPCSVGRKSSQKTVTWLSGVNIKGWFLTSLLVKTEQLDLHIFLGHFLMYSPFHGFWQSFVTIGSYNHLMRIISTYVGNTKKSEISWRWQLFKLDTQLWGVKTTLSYFLLVANNKTIHLPTSTIVILL